MKKDEVLMEQIVSLAKRRGFVFQGSEIYGGLAGTWDYGPLGVLLKNNIKNLWWKMFVTDREDMYGMDAAILMNSRVWDASGHTGAGFADPLIEDVVTKKRYRADHLLEDVGVDPTGLTLKDLNAVIQEKGIRSPDGNSLGEAKQFNMLFPIKMGSTDDSTSLSYLRGETAQGIFVNFKNVVDSFHPKIPFGVAQIGKAFRNEIAPRDFIFRVREFEQMEIEYFIRPEAWESSFEEWEKARMEWCLAIGLSKEKLHVREHVAKERSHYSKRTTDIEFEYPFGKKELYGLAYRTDFDLKAHTEHSGVDLSYYDEERKERFIPHVIEPSVGLDRALLAVLASCYKEDEMGGETRTYLTFPKTVAPYIAAVFPLLKNKPELVEKAREVYRALKKEISNVTFDDNGNIGKRYRRQDEIGTPFCVTIDFDTLGEKPADKDTVTVRNRDTGEQVRMRTSELTAYIQKQ